MAGRTPFSHPFSPSAAMGASLPADATSIIDLPCALPPCTVVPIARRHYNEGTKGMAFAQSDCSLSVLEDNWCQEGHF